MTIKLFVKDDCPRCPAAKKACEGIAGVQTFDVGQIEGLAEASFYGVLATPSVLVIDSQGAEIVSWRGAVPDRALLDRYATVH
jgi:hypothetical protein